MVFNLVGADRMTENGRQRTEDIRRLQSALRRAIECGCLCRGTCALGIDDESDQVPKGYPVDALALRGDEGRGTLR